MKALTSSQANFKADFHATATTLNHEIIVEWESFKQEKLFP